jgi:hypothetical protein
MQYFAYLLHVDGYENFTEHKSEGCNLVLKIFGFESRKERKPYVKLPDEGKHRKKD